MAKVTGKGEFYSLGTGAHPVHPVTAEGKPAAHLGTGAYALDLLCINGTTRLRSFLCGERGRGSLDLQDDRRACHG
ncbi:hypothetical protein AB0D46_31035 [Streptomyces sp. NPDC048383]|uniref:hypothetical protein n=1 Tax=Streptomyces sp. NPDC048383 TaxID=3155386 RepID=UPI00343137E0